MEEVLIWYDSFFLLGYILVIAYLCMLFGCHITKVMLEGSEGRRAGEACRGPSNLFIH